MSRKKFNVFPQFSFCSDLVAEYWIVSLKPNGPEGSGNPVEQNGSFFVFFVDAAYVFTKISYACVVMMPIQ